MFLNLQSIIAVVTMKNGNRCGVWVCSFHAPLVGHRNPSKHSVLSLCMKVRKQSYLPLVLRGPGHVARLPWHRHTQCQIQVQEMSRILKNLCDGIGGVSILLSCDKGKYIDAHLPQVHSKEQTARSKAIDLAFSAASLCVPMHSSSLYTVLVLLLLLLAL